MQLSLPLSDFLSLFLPPSFSLPPSLFLSLSFSLSLCLFISLSLSNRSERVRESEKDGERDVEYGCFIFKRNDGCLGTFYLSNVNILSIVIQADVRLNTVISLEYGKCHSSECLSVGRRGASPKPPEMFEFFFEYKLKKIPINK
jgi:hypothetical protein